MQNVKFTNDVGGEYVDLVRGLERVAEHLEKYEIYLRAGEGSCPPWTPFIITHVEVEEDSVVEDGIRKALGDPELSLKGVPVEEDEFIFQRDPSMDAEEIYDSDDEDDQGKIEYGLKAGSMLMELLDEVLHVTPGGKLTMGVLPLFLAGAWGESTVGGLLSEWVWT